MCAQPSAKYVQLFQNGTLYTKASQTWEYGYCQYEQGFCRVCHSTAFACAVSKAPLYLLNTCDYNASIWSDRISNALMSLKATCFECIEFIRMRLFKHTPGIYGLYSRQLYSKPYKHGQCPVDTVHQCTAAAPSPLIAERSKHHRRRRRLHTIPAV